jgi:SAM-dependent methyltransferase
MNMLVPFRRGGRWISARLSLAALADRLSSWREDRAFDRNFGCDTKPVRRSSRGALASDHAAFASPHVAMRPRDFQVVINMLDLRPEGMTFVDLGSGKGRVLLLAAEQPFARIVGVEFVGALHRVAENNLARRAARLGADPRFELRHEDASLYRLPEEPLLLFLFHPFGLPVMDEVARSAMDSWRAVPRPVRILYFHPVHHDSWIAAGWKKIAGGNGLHIYAPPEG